MHTKLPSSKRVPQNKLPSIISSKALLEKKILHNKMIEINPVSLNLSDFISNLEKGFN